ncbi:MAG: hypothetical protein VCG02_16885 [Verrucomicrobiota bacterium]
MSKSALVGIIGILAAGACGGMLAKVNREKASLEAALAQARSDLAITAAQPIPKAKVIERIVTVAQPSENNGAATAEITRLKAALVAERTARAKDEETPERPPRIDPPEERTPENMKSFMERLKEEDPERYQRMEEQHKNFREKAAKGFNERLTFFTELNVSGLSPEKMEVLAGTVEKLNAMSELLTAIEENPDGTAAFELRGQAREMMRDVGDAMRETREALVTDMISGLGFSEQESNDLMDYLGQINEMTSMRSVFRPPPRTESGGDQPGGGGPGRGPGGPRL